MPGLLASKLELEVQHQGSVSLCREHRAFSGLCRRTFHFFTYDCCVALFLAVGAGFLSTLSHPPLMPVHTRSHDPSGFAKLLSVPSAQQRALQRRCGCGGHVEQRARECAGVGDSLSHATSANVLASAQFQSFSGLGVSLSKHFPDLILVHRAPICGGIYLQTFQLLESH